jgi:hypothetical protein
MMSSMSTDAPPVSESVARVVLHVGRQFRASAKAVVEAALERHPGVVSVEAIGFTLSTTPASAPDRIRT